MVAMTPEPNDPCGQAWQNRWQALRTSLPAEAARRFVQIDLLTHAASLSFYTMLSLAPCR
jgi:uncharacterized BrkB/YihY/UPF0761 family membrane protein